MDEQAKAIAVDIESGEYFSEAKIWYNKVFVYPLKQAVTMRIMGYVALALSVIMVVNIYRVFPLINKINVVTHVYRTDQFYPKLVIADDPSKAPRQFVVESLVAKYIKGREGYHPDMFKTDYIFLLKSSSKAIFDSYYKYIISKEPGAPLDLYLKRQVTRVKIIDKKSDSNNANKVTVTFDKDILDNFGVLQSSSRWKADVEFYLSKYDFNRSTNDKLDFIVTKYTVSKVEKK